MNQSETIAALEKLQAEFNLGKITYNNKNVWPILRYYMALVLMKEEEKNSGSEAKTEKKATTPEKTSILGSLKKILNAGEYIGQKQAFLADCSDTVFVSPAFEPYPDNIEGKKYSRYLDPYIETFSKKRKITKLQLCTGQTEAADNFIPAYTVNEKDFFDRNAIAIKISRRLRKNQRTDMLSTLNSLNDYCKKNNIACYFNSWLIDHLEEVINYEKLFTSLFEKSAACVVFFECYYSPCIFGLISACKKIGIRTVDIQHGNVDINYLAWKNISAEAYHFLPDFYWVWSAADFTLAAANNTEVMKPMVGGNMWLRKCLASSGSSFALKTATTTRKKILVSLQYSFFLPHTVKLIKETINTSGEEFFWMIRFHPLNTDSEKNTTIDALRAFPNVETEQTSAANLYDVLRYANVHIVASSAVAKEGLQFNIPTIIIHEQGADLFRELIQSGVFAKAFDANQLLQKIKGFQPSPVSERYKIETSEKVAMEALETICSTAA